MLPFQLKCKATALTFVCLFVTKDYSSATTCKMFSSFFALLTEFLLVPFISSRVKRHKFGEFHPGLKAFQNVIYSG